MTLAFQKNVPLSQYSTFGIGGPARELIEVRSDTEMIAVLDYCRIHSERYLVIGKGSNSLFSDHGYDGVVIVNRIDHFEQQETLFRVGSGMSFSLLGSKTARLGFTGLEFASGIPGSVGGAVFMNAGANGQETADVLHALTLVNADGETEHLLRKNLSFGYRSSPFQQTGGVLLEAVFQLSRSVKARLHQIDLITRRKETQPLKDRSVGCIFRNPLGKSAGQLIEECGLKGSSVGGAQVSQVHANFIVNQGEATAADVLELIDTVKQAVLKQTGVALEEEVRHVGP